MNAQELTREILQRLKRFRFLIIIAGMAGAGLLILYAKQKPVMYTSRSSVFPLTSSSDNASSSSALSALLGAETSKNFSDEASVNIIELAQSRTTREEVAAIRDSASGDKTIAQLLFEDINNHRSWFQAKMQKPATEAELITWAGDVLKNGLAANINKNNTLILSYSACSPEVVKIVSYGFINKISLFYIELKREKANRDFQFATSKVDSLRYVMSAKDQKLIAMDKRTLFTNTNKLEYRVPAENVLADKQMIRQQYANAIANQQNAAYKLQKVTPLIRILDKPDPPYDVQNKSATFYGLMGFFGALVLVSMLVLFGILSRYVKYEINKLLFGAAYNKSVTPPVASSL